MDVLAGREIIFEFRSSGGGTQVCAVDCASGIEVFVTTPANAMRMDQQKLALRKLAKALTDQGIVTATGPSHENGGHPQGGPPSTGLVAKRGFLA